MDVVSFVLGLTGLIAVADKACSIAQVIAAISDVPKDVGGLLFKLGAESGKLYSWSLNGIKIIQAAKNTKRVIKETEYVVAMRARIDTYKAGIIMALDEAHEICEKYGLLDIVATSMPVELASTLDELQVKRDLELGNILLQRGQTDDLLKKKMSKFKKTKFVFKPWGTPDMQKLQVAISELSKWNAELQSLLTELELGAIRDQLAFHVMAYIDDSPSLQVVQENADPFEDRQLIATARLSEQCILAEKNQSSDEYKQPWKLCQNITQAKNFRSFGLYTPQKDSFGHKVMIEWLNYSNMTAGQEKVALTRLNGLCKLLVTSKPEDLRVLRSKGYIEDVVAHRYGILFDVTAMSEGISETGVISLSQIIPPFEDFELETLSEDLRWTTTFRPTLSQKFELARRLARTFWELHKARWLHKAFDSSKVFFISETSLKLDMRKPYVGGFDYSRPTGINNISLPICLPPGADIYMHPEIRGNFLKTSKYVKYRPAHDIYSLGIVLLEIGIWSKIKCFDKPSFSISDFHQKLAHIAKRNLPHLMGAKYEAVVQYCLSSGMQLSVENKSHEEYSEDSARELRELLYEVVRPLEDCQCRD